MEWIPVIKMLPDNIEFPAKYVGVLFSIEGHVFMAYPLGGYWYISGLNVLTKNLDFVDAWMPVPKQYMEPEKETE